MLLYCILLVWILFLFYVGYIYIYIIIKWKILASLLEACIIKCILLEIYPYILPFLTSDGVQCRSCWKVPGFCENLIASFIKSYVDYELNLSLNHNWCCILGASKILATPCVF